LAHIVGGVHFEGARIGFLLQYKQKTMIDEPEKRKKELSLSSSFQVRLSFFLLILNKNNSCPFKMDFSDNVSKGCFLFTSSDKFNWDTSKRRENRRCRFAIPKGSILTIFNPKTLGAFGDSLLLSRTFTTLNLTLPNLRKLNPHKNLYFWGSLIAWGRSVPTILHTRIERKTQPPLHPKIFLWFRNWLLWEYVAS